MRVVVCLQERVDPAGARALARLLFGSEPPPASGSILEPAHAVGQAADGQAGSMTGRLPGGDTRAECRRGPGGRAPQGPTA
jgi:hypothetical protein